MSRHPFRLDASTPAVIVPITARQPADLEQQAAALAGHPIDALEWRLDHFAPVVDNIAHSIATVSAWLPECVALFPELPVLATFRTAAEGGEHSIPDDHYAELLAAVASTGLVDAVDVEYQRAPSSHIISRVHDHGVPVVASFHDFSGTPPVSEIVDHFTRMEALDADVAKIAVTPHSMTDVLTLLAATDARYQQATKPLISMSMGRLGAVTRLGGGAFGSAATFAALGEVSAPGQLPVHHVRAALDALAAAGHDGGIPQTKPV